MRNKQAYQLIVSHEAHPLSGEVETETFKVETFVPFDESVLCDDGSYGPHEIFVCEVMPEPDGSGLKLTSNGGDTDNVICFVHCTEQVPVASAIKAAESSCVAALFTDQVATCFPSFPLFFLPEDTMKKIKGLNGAKVRFQAPKPNDLDDSHVASASISSEVSSITQAEDVISLSSSESHPIDISTTKAVKSETTNEL